MPVEKCGKKGSQRRLVCEKCGGKSRPVTPNSPAAPELSACEEMEKEGWAYDLGFFSMLTGHRCLCPECNPKKGKGHE